MSLIVLAFPASIFAAGSTSTGAAPCPLPKPHKHALLKAGKTDKPVAAACDSIHADTVTNYFQADKPSSTRWTDYLQAFGIVSAFLATFYSLYLTRKSLAVSNILNLATGYRDVWKTAFTTSSLHRVLKDDVDLTQHPITDDERLFMKMLILHAYNAYLASKSKVLAPIKGLQSDVQDTLSHPIPHQIWLEIRKYQNDEFIEFVEGPLSKA